MPISVHSSAESVRIHSNVTRTWCTRDLLELGGEMRGEGIVCIAILVFSGTRNGVLLVEERQE